MKRKNSEEVTETVVTETPEVEVETEVETPEVEVETEVETPEVEAETEVETEEEVEETEVKNTKVGIVKAGKLNIRKEADREGDVLTIISKGTSVEVFLDESTEDFYCVEVLVNNEFAKGYCVKEFITIK